MQTFFMFGKYSVKGIEGASPERTKEIVQQIEKSGGKVKSIYALLGKYDLVIILDLPDIHTAIKISLILNKTTGISFQTLPAVSVEEFDNIIKKL